MKKSMKNGLAIQGKDGYKLTRFGGSGGETKIWVYKVDNQTDILGLAEREAEFEGSGVISELQKGEAGSYMWGGAGSEQIN